MQRHAEEGARIIDRLGFLEDAVPAIRHHHERFDGTGYPDGLAGEEIPLGARIIHVADALDSMLTTRIYRAARPVHEALTEVQRMAGLAVLPALCRRARGDRRRPRSATCRRRRASRSSSTRRRHSSSVYLHLSIRSTILGGGAEALSRGDADRPAGPGRVPGGHPAALLGRADPGRAAGIGRAARPVADDEGVRGRPRVAGASADGDRALRHVERSEAGGRADATPLRHARGAGRAAAATRRRAGADADRGRHQAASRDDAVDVPLLAHVRLADDGAARGGVRRAGGGGAVGARDRPGLQPRPRARPPAEVRRLAGRPPGRAVDAHRVAGLPHVRRPARSVGDVPVPRSASGSSRTGPRSARTGRSGSRARV